MLGDTNLTGRHHVEGLRRSVAMLAVNTGLGVFNREEALRFLAALGAALAAIPLADEI